MKSKCPNIAIWKKKDTGGVEAVYVTELDEAGYRANYEEGALEGDLHIVFFTSEGKTAVGTVLSGLADSGSSQVQELNSFLLGIIQFSLSLGWQLGQASLKQETLAVWEQA